MGRVMGRAMAAPLPHRPCGMDGRGIDGRVIRGRVVDTAGR